MNVFRHGAQELIAAFSIADGEVTAECGDASSTDDLLAFMKTLATRYKGEKSMINRSYHNLRRFGFTLQVLKTALAASVSWLLATLFTHNNYPYFAPLAAILTVQVTIADSFDKAAQRIIGIIFGVIVSILIGHWLSLGAAAIFVVIFIGMAVSTALRLHPQITSQVAVSSLLVLAFGQDDGYAFGRIVETIIGCVAAIAINALLIPPNAVPAAEQSLLKLSRQAAETLGALGILVESADDHAVKSTESSIQTLIGETEKSAEALRLAKQSQKYSPLQQKTHERLEQLSMEMEMLGKITLQIRGIRRSLLDIRLSGDMRGEFANVESLVPALKAAAACIASLGGLISGPTEEARLRLETAAGTARDNLACCLNRLRGVKSLFILREMGAILTDLSRILRETTEDRAY